jgi:hypothetical protein
MKVNFIIIGAMKCGTTSLSATLAAHPDISFSQPKEPQFFSDVPDWKDKIDEYHNLFRRKRGRIYGEGSTSYTKAISRKTKVWEELYSYNKDLRLIYLVRHPVERAVSQYLHGFQRGFIREPFQTALSKSELLSVGRYYFQIIPFVEKFGRERVLILKFEEFIRDNLQTLKMVSDFLEIDYRPFEGMEVLSKNVMYERRVMTNRQQQKFQKYSRLLRPVLSTLMVRGIREWMIRKNEKRLKDFNFCLTEAQEDKILSYSRLDIQNLQSIVPFDVSDYLLPSVSGKYKPGIEVYPYRST